MTARAGVWCAVIVIAMCGLSGAARAGDAGSDAAAPGAPPKTAPYDAAKAAAAVQIQDPDAATRAYLDSVSPERRDQTKSYAAGNYVFLFIDFAFYGVVMILLLALGVSVRFRNLARRIT